MLASADSSRKSGHRLIGDVDFSGVREVAGWLTPVPGGVGPMTVAMLMSNSLRCAKKQLKVQVKDRHAFLFVNDTSNRCVA